MPKPMKKRKSPLKWALLARYPLGLYPVHRCIFAHMHKYMHKSSVNGSVNARVHA